MRRWVASACVPLVLASCSAAAQAPGPTPPLATESTRPVSRGPTPALPLAKPVAPTPTAPGGRPEQANETNLPTAAARQGSSFLLQSAAFVVGGTYPAAYTCDGGSQSPPLAWSGAPAGTSAFALIEQDTDAISANEPFTHWLLYNMPSGVTQLAPAVPARALLSNGAQQGQNSHLTIGYFGPCPEQGSPPHHYSFELFAQDGSVTLETGASIDEVRSALNGHVLGQARLLATLQR